MPGITNALLAEKVNTLLTAWRNRELELQAWQSGTAVGGPYANGTYPITDYVGTVGYYFSPAALVASVDSPKVLAVAAQVAAEAAEDGAVAAQAAAVAARDLALTYQTGAQAAQALAESAKVYAQAADANAQTYKNAAAASAAAAALDAASINGDVAAADASAAAALASEIAAAASAAAAATFDPANYAALADAETITGAWNFANDLLVSSSSGARSGAIIAAKEYTAEFGLFEDTLTPSLAKTSGFAFRYAGTGNTFSLLRYNDSATPATLFTAQRNSNVVDFKATPTVNSTAVALADHTHQSLLVDGFNSAPDANTFYDDAYGSMKMGTVSTSGTNYPELPDNANLVVAWESHAGGYGRQFFYPDNENVWTRLHQAGSWGSWHKQARHAGGGYLNADSGDTWSASGWNRTLSLRAGASANAMQLYDSVRSWGIGNSGGTLYLMHTTSDTSAAPAMTYPLYCDASTWTFSLAVSVLSNVYVANGYGLYLDGGSSVYLANNTGTYGSIRIAGSKGGYAGIRFDTAYQGDTLMLSTGGPYGGIYSETAAAWRWYWSNNNLFANGAALEQVPTVAWSVIGAVTSARFSRGTGTPTGGSDGDVYFQYT